MRRIAAFGAVLGVLAGLAGIPAAAPAQIQPRALIAFIPTEPAPKMPLLFDLAERDFSYGVTSPPPGGPCPADVPRDDRDVCRARARPVGALAPAGGAIPGRRERPGRARPGAGGAQAGRPDRGRAGAARGPAEAAADRRARPGPGRR